MEIFMKTKRYLTAACAILLTAATLLCGCSRANKFQVSDDGKYVDKKSGVSYIDAPYCYEPISAGEKAYGRLGEADFYEIVGADPTKWLTSSGVVFYAEDEKLPTLSEMDISYASVELDGTLTFSITDSAVLSSLIGIYENSEAVDRPSPALPTSEYVINWRIKFADESLGIYYVLSYFEMSDGRRLLFNRFEERCVNAGNVLERYVAEYSSLASDETDAD